MAEYQWEWLALSSPYTLYSLRAYPSPPSKEELISHFVDDGEVDAALGGFIRKMLDEGYTVTATAYEVDCETEHLRSWRVTGPGPFYIVYYYSEFRTHTRLTVFFDCTPPPIEVKGPVLFVWTPALIVAIAAAISLIVVAAGIFYALQNLTTKKTVVRKHEPDCTWTETITYEPPEWWSVVILGIAIVGVIVVVPKVIEAIAPRRERYE